MNAVPGKEPSKLVQWLWFFISLSGGGLNVEAKRRRPSVRVVNAVGQSRKLFDTSTWDEAVAKAERVRRELATMGIEQWAKRYSLPEDFLA